MKTVFIGASTLTLMTVRSLLQRGHEVVIIDKNKEKIETLSDELDCGFLHGDGTKPAILRESGIDDSVFLFCLTGNDQTNIIASLVGRSMGLSRVITKLEDEELDHICIELGLTETIIPDITIARHLADIVEGQDIEELALTIKGDARVFSFIAKDDDIGTIEALSLPAKARVICIYRNEEIIFPEKDSKIDSDDEVVIISHRDHIEELTKRWTPRRPKK
jgi:trk system potassium uptake protein TrkA